MASVPSALIPPDLATRPERGARVPRVGARARPTAPFGGGAARPSIRRRRAPSPPCSRGAQRTIPSACASRPSTPAGRQMRARADVRQDVQLQLPTVHPSSSQGRANPPRLLRIRSVLTEIGDLYEVCTRGGQLGGSTRVVTGELLVQAAARQSVCCKPSAGPPLYDAFRWHTPSLELPVGLIEVPL